MSPKPTLWFTFEDAFCAVWRVYLGSTESIPQLEGNDGITLHSQLLIGIDESLPDVTIYQALFHEMVGHAAVSSIGDEHNMKTVFACEDADVGDREESMVSFCSPRQFAMLFRNGFLKFPKIPRRKS